MSKIITLSNINSMEFEDIVEFKKLKLKAKVSYYYLDFGRYHERGVERLNTAIIKKTGINLKTLIEDTVGYSFDGSFPEVRNIEDLRKIVKRLLELLGKKVKIITFEKYKKSKEYV